ncbi:hypothetical protein GCM10015535_40340 [Streptomyces gelaticus]|uniref:Uncharacterized protein n=1 Tax=Streptomyces gelaticus TaxID=285446 RepID=A0ABQ2W328_9ACTN|nr:hypothetical protein GCM10015535_40340 [Streptomyces gelaticus]
MSSGMSWATLRAASPAFPTSPGSIQNPCVPPPIGVDMRTPSVFENLQAKHRGSLGPEHAFSGPEKNVSFSQFMKPLVHG